MRAPDFAWPALPSGSRRAFLGSALAFLAGLAGARPSGAYGLRDYFTWVQLRYPGSWDPHPSGVRRFLEELARRTSVEPAAARLVLDPLDPRLYEHPFLYVAGRAALPSLGDDAEAWLRRYLLHGGAVLFDDATGIAESPFARSVAELAPRLIPGRELQPLPGSHTVFQSFYLIRDIPGRRLVQPFLYGAELEDLTPLVLFPNDLVGAWAGDRLGGYSFPCVPGGERQREMTFRMGINLVLYQLTGNYKKDQVHIPFILKRRQR